MQSQISHSRVISHPRRGANGMQNADKMMLSVAKAQAQVRAALGYIQVQHAGSRAVGYNKTTA